VIIEIKKSPDDWGYISFDEDGDWLKRTWAMPSRGNLKNYFDVFVCKNSFHFFQFYSKY